MRGSGSRGERSRSLCARSAALCAGRGGAAGQTKAQSRSAGSQRVTRGHRHRRAPRPKPRWPEVAVRGRTAPVRRSALPKQPKAPSRDARPCPALLLPLRDGTSPAPPPGAPHRAAGAAPLARVRHLPPLRVSAPCPAVRGPAPARPPPPAPPARRGHALAATVGSGFAAAAGGSVRTGASGSTAPGTRAGRPRSPRRAPPTARDGAGRPAIPTHAPAGSRRTSLPRWRPPESAAAAARGCCCRRTGSRSHGTDRRRRARGNPTSCCRRRPPRCRTSRRASAVAEGCPRPDPRSRRAAARRSAPPWRAPGGTAREERPQPLSAHLRRPRPVLWERPPPRPALLRAAPRRGRHSVAMAVPRRAPGRRRWTRNPRAVGGSAGAPVGRAGSC